jgi:microcystin-dependent protein
MSEPFIAEIRIVAFDFAPRGWALCNGQVLAIAQNQALFSLLGTTYGGNGQTTFALPDLRGRTPAHFGSGVTLGQSAGTQTHTLTTEEAGGHTHGVIASSDRADRLSPVGNFWANGGETSYADSADTVMAAGLVSSAGGSQPHTNLAPYLTVSFIIALVGVFPSRN